MGVAPISRPASSREGGLPGGRLSDNRQRRRRRDFATIAKPAGALGPPAQCFLGLCEFAMRPAWSVLFRSQRTIGGLSPSSQISYAVSVSSRAKLLVAIRNNPKDVRFSDACKVAGWLGFTAKGGKGDHCVFQRPGELFSLNFQNRGGKIKPYQARQLIRMMYKYPIGDDGDE